jgi:hypothetical protein
MPVPLSILSNVAVVLGNTAQLDHASSGLPSHASTVTNLTCGTPFPSPADIRRSCFLDTCHAGLFVGVSQSQFFRDLVNFWR